MSFKEHWAKVEKEDSLNPCFNGIWLMSMNNLETLKEKGLGLNPCFNGIWLMSENSFF